MHDNQALGVKLLELFTTCWVKAMDWLDLRMEDKAFVPNNICIRFYHTIEPYMTICYAIKNGDIGLLKHAMREVCIIFQALTGSKPKYVRAILKQVYIFDTKVAYQILQEVYLANTFVNLRDKI